ncbi:MULTISPECIES: DUF1958 domain-containing protein [unclassified Streptococcus]|uniref:DUF1958 domain-containing protein n=1 Tax=unclassified Streptococcus TaxID=2608887 RepID=UPI001430AFED|nr:MULTISPECIES: DUF1958 domain-containing protein [unclassified Streptococcus]MBF0805432.1 D-alanyl-D-alanine carboxypeptidase [Streptococcus sp. 19428wA2_WM07]
MKKLGALLLAGLLVTTPLVASADELMDITRQMYPEVLDIHRPKSSIIVDAKTGDVVWEDNADLLRDPASMSKLMTLYLVFEALDKGEISKDDVITSTPREQAIAGLYAISNNKIVAGVDYTVDELITMTAIPSSNVTTVMLADYLSNGDADVFLDKMNEASQKMGMSNTKWYNASGAAAVSFSGYYTPQRYDNTKENQTTARDMAILGVNFVNKYPDILNYTSDPVVTVKKGTPYEETFETYNYSVAGALYGLEGVDGLKTGSSPAGAFNYIATGERKGERFVELIMGVGDWVDQNGEYYRHPFGNALLEKAFNDYEYKKVLDKGLVDVDGQKYKVDQDVYATVKKGTTPSIEVKDDQLTVNNGLNPITEQLDVTYKVTKDNSLFASAQKVENKSKSKTEKVTAISILEHYQWLLLIPILFLLAVIILLLRLFFTKNGKGETKKGQAKRKK